MTILANVNWNRGPQGQGLDYTQSTEAQLLVCGTFRQECDPDASLNQSLLGTYCKLSMGIIGTSSNWTDASWRASRMRE
jgi:hypothetical protein